MYLQNITRNTDTGLATAAVTWTSPTASDNSGSVILTSSHEPGEDFPIGVTAISYTAADNYSNVITESFIITVKGMKNLFKIVTVVLLKSALFLSSSG